MILLLRAARILTSLLISPAFARILIDTKFDEQGTVSTRPQPHPFPNMPLSFSHTPTLSPQDELIIEYCSPDDAVLQNGFLELDPSPPPAYVSSQNPQSLHFSLQEHNVHLFIHQHRKGQFTVTLSGTLTAPIEDGAYVRVVTFLGVPVRTAEIDLCGLPHISCPVPEGEIILEETFNLQDEVLKVCFAPVLYGSWRERGRIEWNFTYCSCCS